MLANFESPHSWRWLKVFVARGHDVHAVSFYAPARELPGVTVHVLRPSLPGAAAHKPVGARASRLASRAPPSVMRLLNAARYRRAGLARVLRELRPDVVHGHFAVEHGFFGAVAGAHPYVVSAWGSDLFQAPRTPLGGFIARYAIRRADLVTANDPALAREAVRLGVSADRLAVVRLGLDRELLARPVTSVNLDRDAAPATILSDRALEPLYNVDVVLNAFALLRQRLPGARLVVANDGSQRARLQALASGLGVGGSVDFVGHVDQPTLWRLLSGAHVYVSVPSSDSLSLSTMEAMAAGAFPVVSDLPSQDWITHRVTGLRVPTRDAGALAENLHLALTDHTMRRDAVAAGRAKVEAEGDLERNMLAMERLYLRLAGRSEESPQ